MLIKIISWFLYLKIIEGIFINLVPFGKLILESRFNIDDHLI